MVFSGVVNYADYESVAKATSLLSSVASLAIKKNYIRKKKLRTKNRL